MEHIVGIKVRDKILGEVAFITWGRIFDPVDPEELLEVVMQNASKFGIEQLVLAELCTTLQEIQAYPYFYEAIFEYSHRFMRNAKNYKTWQNKVKKAMKKGEQIYFLGISQDKKATLSYDLQGTISHGFWYEF